MFYYIANASNAEQVSEQGVGEQGVGVNRYHSGV